MCLRKDANKAQDHEKAKKSKIDKKRAGFFAWCVVRARKKMKMDELQYGVIKS